MTFDTNHIEMTSNFGQALLAIVTLRSQVHKVRYRVFKVKSKKEVSAISKWKVYTDTVNNPSDM